MLVFRCKAGDRIKIGDIELHINKTTEQNLGLAISAPRDLQIDHVKKMAAAENTGDTPDNPRTLHK